MKMAPLAEILWNLRPQERKVAYASPHRVEVSATRSDRICPHDFAVGLMIPGREIFYPTHVRLFVDLYIKNMSDPKSAHQLFCALEDVYRGQDPDGWRGRLEHFVFPMQIDEAAVNVYYTQLLMIEQDFNYGPRGCKASNYDPPRGYFMGFIRWIASSVEIDKVIFNLRFGAPKKVASVPLDCGDMPSGRKKR
jgi:hypothetical protein